MVAYVLRLRAALLLGSFRGGTRRLVGAVLLSVLGVVALAIVVRAILGLRDDGALAAETVVTLGGAALTLGFALGPIIVGAEDPLDPRRFATFGLDTRALPGVLALASLISVPVFGLIAVAVATSVLWSGFGVPWPVAVGSALLAVMTCVLFARVSAAVAARIFRGRRSRELTGVFIVALISVMVPVGVFVSSLEWRGTVPEPLTTAARLVELTPFGAAWAIPARAGDGAGPMIAIALVSVAVLWALWELLVRTLLTTSDRAGRARERAGLGWFAVLPGTPGGAVAARSLIYWLRDGRYLVNLVVVPVAGVVVTVPMLVAGLPPALVALAPLAVIALFFGWLPHNDTAYDSTAVWLHVSSAMSGAADRLGRLVPVLLVAVPVLAIAIPVALVIHGDWTPLPAVIGACACLLATGLGLSSIASAVAPYPVSRPGDGPFQQPQTSAGAGIASQATVLFGTALLSAPVVWWAWQAITVGGTDVTERALWGGLGIGLGVLAVGVAIGGAVFGRRGTALMEFAETV